MVNLTMNRGQRNSGSNVGKERKKESSLINIVERVNRVKRFHTGVHGK
jgi:hypothetical protein